jgi:hypothetical protein
MIGAMDPKTRDDCEFVAQAIIKRPPAYFIAKGVSFGSGLDDLNEYQVAELVLDDVPFALMRHEGTPVDETQVYLPDSMPPSHVTAFVGRILRELDLPPSAVSWQRQPAG